jgi:predicted ATPase
MIEQFLVHQFAPLWLTIDRVGPFQERLEEIDFTDAGNAPCNLYLFLAKNGRGKTTALELLAALMNMLGRELASSEREPFGIEHLDRGPGRAQCDILLRYSIDGREQTAVLSLLAGTLGSDTSLRFWGAEQLTEVGANEWHRYGFARSAVGKWKVIGERNLWVEEFNTRLALAKGSKVGGFEESDLTWPTLVYFSAYRNVVPVHESEERAIVAPRDWNYQPVHSFRTEGGRWRDSLDNLLVWLKWLDDGRFETAIKLVNERVFAKTQTFIRGIRKEPPEADVVRDNQRLRLDALSSGEKSLVQIFLRLGAHMTRNTIVLLDEPEAHLHENWKFRLYKQLMVLAQDNYPGITVIVATHSTEIMETFAIEIEEEKLRKGGYLFETAAEEERARRIQQQAEAELNGKSENQ